MILTTERLQELATEYGDGTLHASSPSSVWYMSLTVGEVRAMLAEILASRDAEPVAVRAIDAVRRLIRPDAILVAADIQPEGFSRKKVLNALTYLTRTGELAHIGHGRYRARPASKESTP